MMGSFNIDPEESDRAPIQKKPTKANFAAGRTQRIIDVSDGIDNTNNDVFVPLSQKFSRNLTTKYAGVLGVSKSRPGFG